jgi:hypothetical protein
MEITSSREFVNLENEKRIEFMQRILKKKIWIHIPPETKIVFWFLEIPPETKIVFWFLEIPFVGGAAAVVHFVDERKISGYNVKKENMHFFRRKGRSGGRCSMFVYMVCVLTLVAVAAAAAHQLEWLPRLSSFFSSAPAAAIRSHETFVDGKTGTQEEGEDVTVNVFMLCYNEELMIEHTIRHYRGLFPQCKITIYDNESTDNSAAIATANGCTVIPYSTGDRIDDAKYLEIKNNCWKTVTDGWVIMCDMDEWLFITADDLKREQDMGTTMLESRWENVFSDTETMDFLEMYKNQMCIHYDSKYICFRRPQIAEMDYAAGAHTCEPKAAAGFEVKYSQKKYLVKHLDFLSKPYYVQKMKNRWARNQENVKMGWGVHYINDENQILERYNENRQKAYQCASEEPVDNK